MSAEWSGDLFRESDLRWRQFRLARLLFVCRLGLYFINALGESRVAASKWTDGRDKEARARRRQKSVDSVGSVGRSGGGRRTKPALFIKTMHINLFWWTADNGVHFIKAMTLVASTHPPRWSPTYQSLTRLSMECGPLAAATCFSWSSKNRSARPVCLFWIRYPQSRAITEPYKLVSCRLEVPRSDCQRVRSKTLPPETSGETSWRAKRRQPVSPPRAQLIGVTRFFKTN